MNMCFLVCVLGIAFGQDFQDLLDEVNSSICVDAFLEPSLLQVESDYKMLGVAAGAFSLDQPGWLLRSSCQLWFHKSFNPLHQGQLGQEDGGGVNSYPGFRSVCQISDFSSIAIVFRFALNDAGRSMVTTLVARILEDPQLRDKQINLSWTTTIGEVVQFN